MKYLKLFENTNNSKKEELADLLLPFEDYGFDINISESVVLSDSTYWKNLNKSNHIIFDMHPDDGDFEDEEYDYIYQSFNITIGHRNLNLEGQPFLEIVGSEYNDHGSLSLVFSYHADKISRTNDSAINLISKDLEYLEEGILALNKAFEKLKKFKTLLETFVSNYTRLGYMEVQCGDELDDYEPDENFNYSVTLVKKQKPTKRAISRDDDDDDE